jgi:hypothetical protein
MRSHILLSIIGLLLLTLTLPPTAGAQSLYHGWSDRYGIASGDAYCYSAATDAQGNIVITGALYDSLDFGGGYLVSESSMDIYVAKFDPTGNHAWSASFGDLGIQKGNSIAMDHLGNVIVVGDFVGTIDFGGDTLTSAGTDIFIAKFDPAGHHLWSRNFGNTSPQWANGVAIDGSNNMIMTGNFYGTVDFGGGALTSEGEQDIYLVKFDAAGNHIWSDRFGTVDEQQHAIKVATDGSDNVILTGEFEGTVDFGGGGITSAGSYDVYVAKFDAAGNHMWSQCFGDTSVQWGRGVATDGNGNVIVAGTSNGSIDFGGGVLSHGGGEDAFVASFDAAGNHLWSHMFGDAEVQRANRVAADGSGNVVLTGNFRGSMDFGGGALTSAGLYDAYVARFDAAGNHLWSQRYGDSSSQSSLAATTDGLGNAIIAGHFQGTINFGGGDLTSVDGYDIFVAKLWRAEPEIACVDDIPGDQGGWINLCWDASGADNPGEQDITHYTLWRAIAPTAHASLAADTEDPAVRIQHFEGMTYYWSRVDSIPAYYLPGYSEAVPTLFDSTAVSPEVHYFQVIAHTNESGTFYTSAPDSGRSVDNLAPAIPTSLTGEQEYQPAGLWLRWDANTEADLAVYRVYRGNRKNFIPSPIYLVATTTKEEWFDNEWRWDVNWWYKVSAVDIHFNEGLPALTGRDNVTGAGDPVLPDAFALGQNVPNPFNPTTTIRYHVPAGGAVTLRVYDVSGRLVRTLVDGHQTPGSKSVIWNGADDRGHGVSSGVYFYRMEAPGFSKTRKMLLLQ